MTVNINSARQSPFARDVAISPLSADIRDLSVQLQNQTLERVSTKDVQTSGSPIPTYTFD